jgi:8-oxo-dGTP diphosphatase
MTETKPLILVAAAAIIDVDNRVLIQKRPEGKSYAGFWEFPGGKLEKNETPEAALIRELFEELGIVTIEKAFFPLTFMSYEYPNGPVLMPLFGCRNWVNAPLPRENQELAWVRPARLADYKLLESNIPLIAPLMQLI